MSRAGVAAALLPNVVAAAPALPAVLLPVLAELRRGTANSVGAQARIKTANNTAAFSENAPAILDREHVEVRRARWPCRVFVIRRADLAPATRAWLSCKAPVDWRLKNTHRPKGSKLGVMGGRLSKFGVLGLYASNVLAATPPVARPLDSPPRRCEPSGLAPKPCGLYASYWFPWTWWLWPPTDGRFFFRFLRTRKAHGSELRLLKQAQAAAAREAYLEPWTDLSNRQPMPPGWTWLVTSTRSPPAFPR